MRATSKKLAAISGSVAGPAEQRELQLTLKQQAGKRQINLFCCAA